MGDPKDMEDATVVASPSFDAMLEERGERISEEPATAVDARSYDEQVAARAAKSHDADAFAATASGPSYDARLDAMGLPIPADLEPAAAAWSDEKPGNDPGVPKTMVLSPQQWGLPAQPPASPPQPPAGPSAPYAQQYGQPQAQYAPQHAVAAAPKPQTKSSLMLFLLSAVVTLVVFGTCAAGVIAYLVLRD